MANHKATRKDARQNAKRNLRNRYQGKTARGAMRKLIALTDKDAATKALPSVVSMIDKLAKRGIIHKNKAGNLKRRMMRGVQALGAESAK